MEPEHAVADERREAFRPRQPLAVGAGQHEAAHPRIGETYRIVRLAALFMAGTCFYLFRDRIALHLRGALVAAVLFVCLNVKSLAEFGVAAAGGYLIFWAARAAPAGIKHLNTANDIPDGFYLYTFPFVQLIVLRVVRPQLGPVILADLDSPHWRGR